VEGIGAEVQPKLNPLKEKKKEYKKETSLRQC